VNNYDWNQIKHRADGSWQQILGSLAGIDSSMLRNKHGPCPNCGGKDRFRFDDKQGTGSHFCSQCGAGDGMSLLVKCSGMSFPEAVEAVGRYLMLDPSDQKRVYTAPKKVNKIVSTRKNDFVDEEKSRKWMVETDEKQISEFSIRFRISKTWLNISEKGYAFFLVSRAGKFTNCFGISKNGELSKYAAKGMTNGGYHRINKNEGKSIFFCVNIIDSHLTAQFTNCECVCVFEYANLLDAIAQYIEDYKPENPIYVSINNSETELILAESAGFKIIMPLDSDDIQTSSGFHKKLFNPTEVLDSE
jgi:phage/plasmid primase-like uncharacterized protein